MKNNNSESAYDLYLIYNNNKSKELIIKSFVNEFNASSDLLNALKHKDSKLVTKYSKNNINPTDLIISSGHPNFDEVILNNYHKSFEFLSIHIVCLLPRHPKFFEYLLKKQILFD